MNKTPLTGMDLEGRKFQPQDEALRGNAVSMESDVVVCTEGGES